MHLEKIVIIGAGQGGFQMAASLRQEGFQGQITLIGDEPGLPYQRPPLSKTYLKDGNADRLALRPGSFYAQNTIDLLTGTRVENIDRAAKTVVTEAGQVIPYDHLVLAIGSRNAVPPIANLDLKNVLSLRTLADARDIRGQFAEMKHVIVVGGGFIGLEFAAVARAAGIEVTVVEGAARLMARAVSEPVSDHFRAAHEGWGAKLVFDQFAAEVLDDGTGRAAGIRLADGREIAGDYVLVAAGIHPNTELAGNAGLKTSNGIEVDQTLSTSDPDISALGDCCLFPEPVSGTLARLESVQAATDHARCIAKRLTGAPEAYRAAPWFWSDQGDRKLQIAGLNTGVEETLVLTDESTKLTVLGFRNGNLACVETVNSAVEHMSARKILGQDKHVTKSDLDVAGYDLRAVAKSL